MYLGAAQASKGRRLDRDGVEAPGKIALGWALHSALQVGRIEHLFFDLGTTPELSLLGMIEGVARGSLANPFEGRESRRSDTNSFLVFSLLQLLNPYCPRLEPKLLFGNKKLDPSYGGFFPVSNKKIVAAMDDAAKNRGGGELGKACFDVRKAWEHLLALARRFDLFTMTATSFSFVFGPFVNSLGNALLKNAFLTAPGSRPGSRQLLLFDGSKIMDRKQVEDRWDRGFIQVIDGAYWWETHPKLKDALSESTEEFEKMMEKQARSRNRNPVAALGLKEALILEPRSRNRVADKVISIKTPGTWWDCVRAKLERKEELEVWVSQSEHQSAAQFHAHLSALVVAANQCLSHPRIQLSIAGPEPHPVLIEPRSFSIVSQRSASTREVTIYRCRYTLASGANSQSSEADESTHKSERRRLPTGGR